MVQPDPASAPIADLNQDGDVEDTVLQVFDPASGEVRTLGEAGPVAVVGDVVAFLRPNPAGRMPTSRPGITWWATVTRWTSRSI